MFYVMLGKGDVYNVLINMNNNLLAKEVANLKLEK